MAVQVPVELLISIEKAIKDSTAASNAIVKQLGKIDDGADKASSKISGIGLALGAAAIAAAAAGVAIAKGLSKSIEEATEANDAINSLTNALRASGDLSEQNVQAFQDLAEELSSVSRFSDDSILAQVRLGKQFGLTNRETEKLLRTSVEYAAFAKEDLGTVVRQLGQTFDGTAGRIAESIPGLRNLSKEALRSGAALDVVLQQLRGSAAADVNTFSGALEQAGNRFGDIFENIGNAVVDNQAVVESIKLIGETFKIVADAIANSNNGLKDLVTGILQLAIQSFGTLLEMIGQIDRISTRVSRFFSRTKETAAALGAGEDVIRKIEAREKAQDDRAAFFDRLTRAAADASASVERISKAQENIKKNVKETASGFDNQISRNLRLMETDEERKKLQEERIKLLEKEKQIIEDIFQKNQANLKNIASNPLSALPGAGDSNRLGLTVSDQETVAAGVGFAGAALQGRQGATNLLAQGAELAGQAFLGVPGLGEVFKLLAQGPDAVREMVKQFADAVPDIIVAVAEAIPVVIETLAEKLPEIITRLAENAPRIIAALIKATPAFIVGFTKGLVQGAGKFLEEIVRGAGRFIQEILNGAGRFIQALIDGLKEGIGKVFDGLNPFSGSNSGVGGLVGGIGNVIGNIGGAIGGLFGKGSEAGAGFSPSIVGFQESSQPVNVSLKIGQREFANAMFDVNRQGFRTT